MFVQLMLFSLLFQYCLTRRNHSMGICQPVVRKCQNGSCHYRRYNHHLENVVYFRYLRDCKRLCPVIRQKRNDHIINLHVSESFPNYNDTVYVQLHVDLSPEWIQRFADGMNMSTQNYYSQIHYFQNYRRRFTNYANPIHQLMLVRHQNVQKKNY